MAIRHNGHSTDGGSLEAKLVVHKGQRLAIIGAYGVIGQPRGFGGYQFINSLSELGNYDVLYAILDSPGGSVVDAWVIYHFLIKDVALNHRSLVLITGECSGNAILIALAFGQILMRPGSFIRFQPVQLRRTASGRQVTGLIARLIANVSNVA